MLLELIKLCLILGLLVFNGMLFYRVITLKLLNADLSEEQLFYHGLFLSMIINGIIGQYLALFRLFNLFAFLIVFASGIVLFRTEALAILKYTLAIPSRFIELIKHGRLLQVLALCLFIILALLVVLQVQVPSLNVDVWVHQIPIAESIVNNGGFVYPLVPHLFYGNMPSFINLLFAEGLILINNYNIASLIHFFIYFSFIILLYSFSGRNRTLALILLSWIFLNPLFKDNSVTAMTDTAHACIEAASLVFLITYLNKKSVYYLFFSAVLCGAALASKYLGFITLFLYGLILMSDFKPQKDFLKKFGICLLGILVVSVFWYGKNWTFYNNPIYPYLFGHPGLSDAWMADLKADQGMAFYPQFRGYSRDITSLAGWHDFLKASYNIYFDPRTLPIMLIVVLLSLFFVRSAFNFLTIASGIYFAIWYFFIFHHGRYGITAFLLFNCTFYLSVITIAKKILDSAFVSKLYNYITSMSRMKVQIVDFTLNAVIMLLLFSLLNIKDTIKYFYSEQKKLVMAYIDKKSFEVYMSDIFPHYEIYKFIADNHLRQVLNPFDNGSILYMKYIIPGRKSDDVFLPWYQMIASKKELSEFLFRNKVKYFVRLSLPPIAIERLGKKHTDMTAFLVDTLIPRSEMIYSDELGNQLFKIKEGG
jgi:hypothetical protein